jgi:hypothetical protein
MTPTADHIAIAIVAACKETGADPEHVAMGANTAGRKSNHSIPRARAYAAIALRAVFEGAAAPMIARAVGYNKAATGALAQIDFQFRQGLMRWWDDAAFMRVVAALEAMVGQVEKDAVVFKGTAVCREPVVKAYPILRAKRPLGARVTEEVLRDPAPGRSALEARRGR